MKFKEEIRYDYPLTSDSLVFDVGGYEGSFAQGIFDKYGCRVYVFEPVREFYEKIVERFKNNPKITVFNYGLSNRTGHDDITVDGDGSSLYLPGEKIEEIQLIDISGFILKNDILHVDLIKINIEGEEYPLLNHLIATKLIKIFDNIQIQFHKKLKHEYIIGEAVEFRNEIVSGLWDTHKRQWNYPFIWESWKR